MRSFCRVFFFLNLSLFRKCVMYESTNTPNKRDTDPNNHNNKLFKQITE